jgi:kanamycin nucleotidyltransferase
MPARFCTKSSDARDEPLSNRMDDIEALRILRQGPQRIDINERRAVVEKIVSRLDSTFGDSVIAIGLYGSTARDADRDFSDIEMFCVLRNPGYDRRLEWVFGKGKAEVELFGEDAIRQRSAQLDEVWPVTHAVFANPKRIKGEPAFFAELRRLVYDHTEAQFDDAIRGIIVGELYEGLGKVRNSILSRAYESLPRVTMRIAIMAELMVGLAHKHIYTAAGLATAESMNLTPRPANHDELCLMVARGELNNPNRISDVIESYWKGVIEWVAVEHIDLAPVFNWPF